MRGILLSLVCAAGLLAMTPAKSTAAFAPLTATMSAAPAPVYALQVPDKTIDININSNRGGARWYRSPVWIAIGVLALIVLVMLIVLLTRSGGGGTTIVRE
jgi:hypothetical protein